jgi:hypothetical protein
MATVLPEGFELDVAPAQNASLPEGFQLDAPAAPTQYAKLGEVDIALPQGMSYEQIQQNRKQAMEKALATPERQAYQSRLAEGQKKGFYSTPDEDPTGARRPMRFSPSEFATKAFGAPYETEETKRTPEAVSVGSGDFFADIKRGGAFVLGSEPEERVQITKSLIPDAEFRYDEMGNIFVKYPNGEEGVLNKPGFSREDAYRIASDIAKFAPAARGTAMATSTLGRMGIGALASGATSTLTELGQKALGGDVDFQNVALDTAFGGGAELAVPFLKWAGQKLTPQGRQALANAKTLGDLVDAGLDRKAIKSLVDDYDTILKEARDLDIPPPMAAQALAGEGSSQFQRPLARLVEGASSRDDLARKFVGYLEERSDTLFQAARKTLARFQRSTPMGALENARKTAQELIKGKVEDRRAFADVMYENAFQNAPKIDLRPLRLNVDELIETTARNSAPRKKLEQIKKMLESEDYLEAMEARAKDLEAQPQLFYARDRPIPKAPLPIPDREIDPRILQQVNWDLRDLSRISNDKAITAATKNRAAQMEKKITAALNRATKGGYGAADAKFKQMSGVIEELQQGMVGEAASKSDTTLKSLVTSVFNPKPEQVELSARFMRLLRSKNKAAADDLYSTYFISKLDNLSEEARPSDIYKAIFGKGEDQANVIMQLAPDQSTQSMLAKIRKQLEIASRSDTVSMGKVASNVAKGEERSGPIALIGKMLNPLLSSRRGLEGISAKKRAEMMFNAALDEKWSKELRKILNMKPTAAEIDNEIDGFFNRMAARMQLRGDFETAASATLRAEGSESTNQQQQ